MEVIWSPRATAEFGARVQWLEQNLGQRQARRYLEEVLAALEKIINPRSQYRLVKEKPETRCCPVNGQIKLYYRPGKQSIELVTFFDARQDPGRLKL